ncbi:hypothetical protein [Vibrio mimicus]|uniref:hypothetical protein n=1 Tax=Vibrio mimicus TaxID=674 RepID=UPI0005116695|nr:hypothetical protein [Vibrio mimicus]
MFKSTVGNKYKVISKKEFTLLIVLSGFCSSFFIYFGLQGIGLLHPDKITEEIFKLEDVNCLNGRRSYMRFNNYLTNIDYDECNYILSKIPVNKDVELTVVHSFNDNFVVKVKSDDIELISGDSLKYKMYFYIFTSFLWLAMGGVFFISVLLLIIKLIKYV